MAEKPKKMIERTKSLFHSAKKRVHHIKKKVKTLKDTKPLQHHESALEKLQSAPMEQNYVHVSPWSVVKATVAVLGVILLAWLLFSIQHILILLFVSVLFAAALDPVVDKWEKYRIPRGLSVIICYIIGLFALLIMVSMLVPMMVQQIGKFTVGISDSIRSVLVNGVQSIPLPWLPTEVEEGMLININRFIEDLDLQTVLFNVQEYSAVITNQLSGIAGNFWAFLTATFNGVFNALLVLIITFFLIVDKENIRRFMHSLLPARYEEYVSIKSSAVQLKIGHWVRGQLVLCFSVGIAVYIGLWILSWFGIDIAYKETLAVLAGITELIPVVGPILGMVPALMIAMNTSFFFVLWVILLYFIVQQLENNILVPLIMNHAVGLNPVVIILVMLVGAQFFGILGVILAIPVATSVAIFVQDYAKKPK